MTRTCTITTLRRPIDGHTHRVRTPLLRGGVLVGSIEDARKVAAGYQPAPGETVVVNEVNEVPQVNRPAFIF